MKGGQNDAKPLLRTDAEITELYQRHVKTVYRVCFAYMKKSLQIPRMLSDNSIG
jgi:RNA polymerase sigma-70 factor (ECF subfamily)